MAAPTQYYVDPASGSDGNAGTSGSPWATLKYAIETGITADTTNGDQINLKAGTADVYSSGDPAIDLQLYAAAATATAPLIIRGYTSTANDGGRGAITCTGRPIFNDAAFDHLKLIDLDITGGSTTLLLQADQGTHIFNCVLTQTAAGPNTKIDGNLSVAMNSAFIGCGANALICEMTGSTGYAFNNVFREVTNVCYGVQGPGIFVGNVVHINATSGASGYGISTSSALFYVVNNTLVNAGAGTIAAISGSGTLAIVLNNYVEGWSGTGGKAISLTGANTVAVAGNRWYNCNSSPTYTDANFDFDNSSLGASALTNPGSSDYTPLSDLLAAGYPESLLSIGDLTNLNIGALMSAIGAGGGLMSHPGMSGRMNG